MSLDAKTVATFAHELDDAISSPRALHLVPAADRDMYRYVLKGGGEQSGAWKTAVDDVGDVIVTDDNRELLIPWTSVKYREKL